MYAEWYVVIFSKKALKFCGYALGTNASGSQVTNHSWRGNDVKWCEWLRSISWYHRHEFRRHIYFTKIIQTLQFHANQVTMHDNNDQSVILYQSKRIFYESAKIILNYSAMSNRYTPVRATFQRKLFGPLMYVCIFCPLPSEAQTSKKTNWMIN